MGERTMSGVLSSQPSPSSSFTSGGLFHIRAETQARLCNHYLPVSVKQQSNVSRLSVTKLKTYLGLRYGGTRRTESRGIGIRCNSSTGPAGSGSGDGDSKSVLDAFFLGKALAEALNERIESTVGEFLSTIGRLQAEQQKQIQEFQDDVLERAKKAKEIAAREALEAQGLISKPAAVDTTVTDGVTSATSASTSSAVTAVNSRSYPNQTTSPSRGTGPDPAGTAFEVANDE